MDWVAMYARPHGVGGGFSLGEYVIYLVGPGLNAILGRSRVGVTFAQKNKSISSPWEQPRLQKKALFIFV